MYSLKIESLPQVYLKYALGHIIEHWHIPGNTNIQKNLNINKAKGNKLEEASFLKIKFCLPVPIDNTVLKHFAKKIIPS